MCLKFGLVIFLQKDFGAKAAHKMLVKLTPGKLGLKRHQPGASLQHGCATRLKSKQS